MASLRGLSITPSPLTIRPLLACLVAALLTAASAAAQAAPGTPAEQAAARLVEATRGRDLSALATFVDPKIAEKLAKGFPATAAESDEEMRALLLQQGVDADSLLEALHASGPGTLPDGILDLRILVSMGVWMRSLYGDGSLDAQSVTERVLSLAARCNPELPLALFDSVRYDPVRADVRADGTVEVIGRISATIDGETRDRLTVTPLWWTEGRWTVASGEVEARDAELNPVAEFLGLSALDLMYLVVQSVQADVEGTVPGCLDVSP